MNPHHTGTLRIEGTMANTVFVLPVLRNSILYSHNSLLE